MFHAWEVAERLAYYVLLDAGDVGCNAGSQRVVYVVLSGKRQCFLLHIKRFWLLYLVLSFLYVSYASFFLQFRERILDCLDVILGQFLLHHRVVIPVDECILRCLVSDDAHL